MTKTTSSNRRGEAMGEAAAIGGIISVIGYLVSFIIGICLMVAVFQTSTATKKTALETARIRFLLNSYLAGQGSSFVAPIDPCKKCSSNKTAPKEVQLHLSAKLGGQLVCPSCKGIKVL